MTTGITKEPDCVTFGSDCHVRPAAELLSHTWDPVVLSVLRLGPIRRGALIERIAGISDKALTESLRRLAARGLITRSATTGAVYRLTELGSSFAEGPLASLAHWAAEHQAELV